MKFEHLALNVADPVAMAAWYVAHLGMQIRLALDGPPWTRFIADSAGSVMFELYHNPPDAVPDYRSRDILLFHLAFVSADPDADRTRLLAAGATPAAEARSADGTVVLTLRDPWGVPFQLCKRARRLL